MSVTVSEQLPLLAASPNGIKKLRELILALAVRGKLVPQGSHNEPADTLVAKVRNLSRALIAKGDRKKDAVGGDVDADEAPYELPIGWAWARIADSGRYINGLAFKPQDWSDQGRPIIRIQNLSGRSSQFNRTNRAVDDDYIVRHGEILVSWSATLDTYFWRLEEDGVLNQHIFRVIPSGLMAKEYLYWVLKTAIREMDAGEHAHGLVMTHINRGPFLAHIIGTPPIEEQHRIAAKVAELMALCDRLEAQQADAESAHSQLVTTLLESLTQASNNDDFAASWQRLSAHFHTLFTSESSISALKQVLLQLAVMGKLMPQDSRDEPAGELLKRISEEKKRQVDKGRIKRQKPPTKIADEEKLFALPIGWKWQRFADFALDISTGPFGSLIHKSDYVDGGVPLVNPSHMIDGRITPDFSVSLSPEMAESMTTYRISAGDMVMARRGEVGRVALVTEAEEGWLCGTGSFVLRFVPEISRSYIRSLFECSSVRAYLAGAAVGTTMVNLNHGILLKMPIAVPPIAEQHRIVSKVNQLMSLCDRLSVAVQKRNQHGRHLADALVDKALSPAPEASTNVVDLSCYLVSRLAARPTFGRTAHMKLIYLADTHLGLNLHGNYMRETAGPLDKNLYQMEEQAEANGWYTHTLAPLKSGKEKITYHATKALAEKAQEVAEGLSDKRHELDRLIALLGNRNTEELEIVATLFAAWNDALLDGQSPDDGWIIREVRENWHVEKQRFTPDRLRHWLNWMRDKRLVPAGRGSHTQHQAKLL